MSSSNERDLGNERLMQEVEEIINPAKALQELESAIKGPTLAVHEQLEIKGVLFEVAEVKTRGRVMLKLARPRRWRCLFCQHREIAVRRPDGCPKCKKVSHESMVKQADEAVAPK